MSLWFKSRRTWIVLLAACAAGVVAWLYPDVLIKVPDFRHGSTTPIPLIVLLAVVPAVVVAVTLTRRWHQLEIRNQRGVWWLDIAVACAPVVAYGVVALSLTDTPSAVALQAATQTSGALVAVTLISVVLIPPGWAAIPALLWMITSCALGRSGEGFSFWAWPADSTVVTFGTVTATVILFLLGATAYVTQQHPTRWEAEAVDGR